MLIAQGGAFGGWSLYLHEGVAHVLLQPARPPALQGRGAEPLAPGEHEVRVEFAYDGGGLGKGGDGHAAASTAPRSATGRLEVTVPMIFSRDETTDVGERPRRPRSATTTPAGDNRFTGTIAWVQIDLGDDALDHVIPPRSGCGSRSPGSGARGGAN